MNVCRSALLTLSLVLASAAPLRAQSSSHVRSVDQKPMLDLGGNDADSMSDFTTIAGATRLRDGTVIVADQMRYTVRVFDARGNFLRTMGRKGEGPGEYSAIIRNMYRCGDSLFVIQWNRNTSVFSGAGKFGRMFRFDASAKGQESYATACNRDRLWASYGWDHTHVTRPGSFRTSVPAWVNNPDGTVRSSLGNLPGSERFPMFRDGRVGGDGPLPLGKQTVLAIGRTRVYVGTEDSAAVAMYGLDGQLQGSIRVGGAIAPVTKADIAHFIERDTAGKSPPDQKSELLSLKTDVEWPKMMPAYRALMVDSEDDLWVQAYPVAGQAFATWNIFSASGQRVTTVQLPLDFEINEIGADYLIGHMPDGPDRVTHVKVYRVRRS
jgi:6-bladed beta-propeller